MTDAAIKAALEAAGEAARKAVITPGCCMEGTGCEIAPCHCSQVAASAAIAAFLRALPEMGAWNRKKGRAETASKDVLDKIAAAVEAAAREGGGWASTT